VDGVERLRSGPAAAVGDPRLFEEFYRRHVDAVLRFVEAQVSKSTVNASDTGNDWQVRT
jgi:hypothetical protein